VSDDRQFPNWDSLYLDEKMVENLPWFNKDLDKDLQAELDLRNIRNGRFLDLGTGPATQALRLASLGFDVTGTDISENAIQRAKRTGRAKFVVDDILDSRLEGKFDYIFDRGCFHVLPVSARAAYVKNVVRILEDRGFLFLKCFSSLEPASGGPFKFTPDMIRQIFSSEFDLVSVKETEYQGTLNPFPKALFAVMQKRKYSRQDIERQMPKIVPLPNGPLYLINSSEKIVVENLQDSKGQPISTVIGVALCRCGQSKNKPFCDGSHAAAGFSSQNTADKSQDKKKSYVGKKITIHDNRAACSHSAECIRNLESVFSLGQRPWINPDGASVDEIIAAVRKCPSGALSYSVDNIEYRDFGQEPMVTVTKNGPYHVTGGIELVGSDWAQGVSKEHYTLCRCGASKNKPFCDGSHYAIKFRD